MSRAKKIMVQGTMSGVNAAAWGKVWWGMLLSVLLGLVLGGGLCVLMRLFLGRGCLERAAQRFRRWQVAGAAAMAFCHGAQDGQKFLGVLLLAEALRAGRPPQLESAPLWEALLCALVMGAGTAVGGRRIIRAVGQDMTSLMPYQGFAADTAAVACLLLATAGGLPVSTTHTKTCAVMGAGAAGGMGGGMVAFFGSTLQMGIETVLDTVGFDKLLEGADMVFSGEGKLDAQSLLGKVVIGVARRAKRAGVPLVAVVGDIGDNIEAAYDMGVSAVFSINRVAVPFREAKPRSKSDLALTMDNLMRFCRRMGW